MKKKILVVEDDKLNAKFFEFTLHRRCGHEVEVTEDVERILERVRSGQIDVVIMDVSLSNSRHEGQSVSGSEICRMLKADERTRHVPVLLATAHAMKGDREELLKESGADDYISKPIADPADLIQKVDALLAVKR
jgi:CheY-like chemotaxis protein